MRNKTCLILIIVVFLTNLNAEKAITKENTFIRAINKHRSYLLSFANDTLLDLSEYQKKLFVDYIRDSLSDELDAQWKNSFLQRLAFTGRRISAKKSLNIDKKIRFLSDYIEDKVIYYLCILAFEDEVLRNLAYDILKKHSRLDYLSKYSKEVKDVIQNVWENNKKNNDKANRFPYDELYMMLPLSKSEKSKLLKIFKETSIPAYYLARLGDQKAEKKLIDRFKKAAYYSAMNNSESKARLALQIGIAGTPKCARALISELNSPIADKRMSGNYTSIRVPIIKALGKMHPEMPILRIDIAFIKQKGDIAYGGEEKIKNYLDNIFKWAEKTYNVKPKGESIKPLLSRVVIE